MANPSVKKGYIAIANELVEQLAKVNIPGNEMRLIWVVWRQTWGYKKDNRRKDWDWISFSQLEEKTNMKRANCFRGIKSLLAKKLILQEGNRYKFNQDYSEWVLAKRLTVLAKSITPISQKTNKIVSQKATYKRKKENITKETSELGSQVNKVFTIFDKINPTLNWGNKTTRSSAEFMIKKFGLDGTLQMARQIVAVQGKPYAPVVTTPYQMKEKLAQFKIYFDNQKTNKSNFTQL